MDQSKSGSPRAVTTPKPTARVSRSARPKVERVAVPCCSCGEPTGMKVPRSLLEELELFELCKDCVQRL